MTGVIYIKYRSILQFRHHLPLFSSAILIDKNTFLILQFFVPPRRMLVFLSLEPFSHFIIPFVFRLIDRRHAFVYKPVTIKLLYSFHIWVERTFTYYKWYSVFSPCSYILGVIRSLITIKIKTNASSDSVSDYDYCALLSQKAIKMIERFYTPNSIINWCSLFQNMRTIFNIILNNKNPNFFNLLIWKLPILVIKNS